MNDRTEAPEGAGAKLKAWMDSHNVTVTALSEQTGLSKRTITAIRSGSSAGNFATWRAICRRTGLDVNEIMGL